jgi:membrane associated rhomboid family serine protease
MNWKLILLLSLTGILAGLANVYVVPAKYSALVETPISLLCAYILARAQERRHFLHGLTVGAISAVLATATRLVLLSQYLAHQPADAQQYIKMAEEAHGTVAQAIIMMGIFFTIVSGIVVGLFSLAAGKIINKMSGR